MNDNKEKALSVALSQLERQFGKGSIMKLGDNRSMDVETISTGSLGLDIALGAGGLPLGRVVEIYGTTSRGTTTLTLEVIAEAQRNGKICAFVDKGYGNISKSSFHPPLILWNIWVNEWF